MIKLLKHLKHYIPELLLCVVLLVAQAASDLALPGYTSVIVDVGIQNGGIEYAVPVRMRAATYESLLPLLDAGGQASLQQAYRPEADIYQLADQSKDNLIALDQLFARPLAMLSVAQDAGGLSPGASGPAAQAGSAQAGISDAVVRQRAAAFIRAEYAALGMDTGAIQTRYLLTTGAKMLGVTLAMVVAALLNGLVSGKTGSKVSRDLRQNVFTKVLSFSGYELDQFSTASLITRSTADIRQINIVVVLMLRMVLYAPILGIGGILKVFQTNTGMSWIIGVAVVAVAALVGVLMGVALPKFKKMQQLVDKLNLVSREVLTGLPVIRAFSNQARERQRFNAASEELMRTQLFTGRAMAFMMPTMMLIMNGVSAAIVWFGAQGIDAGTLQVGGMIAFINYAMQIIMSFMMLTMAFIMLPRAAVSAGRIQEVLNMQPSIVDPPSPRDGELALPRGEVRFQGVSFRFPGAQGNVLQNIDFTAPPGAVTAIVGSTGSGKSTLINLIVRLYDVTEGSVSIDGVDVRELSLHKLRSLLGYVPQKSVLFSGNIASNIDFAGEGLSPAQLAQAARTAQAEEFILEKEHGYQSAIAQGGTNVSGGQKQRLSIARAIARNPKIYLFDDCFSALDYKTDAALRRALVQSARGATVIIVAQRISTVLHADQIIVLDDGAIAGIGTHRELLETSETYREIARSQLSDAELQGVAQ